MGFTVEQTMLFTVFCFIINYYKCDQRWEGGLGFNVQQLCFMSLKGKHRQITSCCLAAIGRVMKYFIETGSAQDSSTSDVCLQQI
jgi:hypothetical protein